MRIIKIGLLLVVCALAAGPLSRAAEVREVPAVPVPLLRTVAPEVAKTGDIATVSGDYLNSPRLGEVYLTDGKADFNVEILSRTDAKLKIKVPANAPPARYTLMILLLDEEPKLIEQPAKLRVE